MIPRITSLFRPCPAMVFLHVLAPLALILGVASCQPEPAHAASGSTAELFTS